MRIPPFTRHIAIFSFSMALLAGTESASAAAIFRVFGQGGEGIFDQSSPSFLSRASLLEGSFTDPNTGYSNGSANNAFAAAGPGGLRVDANSKVFNTNPAGAGGYINTAAAASMSLDDVMISGPAGAISTSYTIHLSGTLEASTDLQALQSGASASATVYLFGNGNLLNNGVATKNNGVSQTGIGLLQNFTGDNNLATDPFIVTANQAFSIMIQLSTGTTSAVASDTTGTSIAAAHFGNSLTFATDRPVFNLPDGYTANSISGNIVDNHFVASAVPLPTAMWLLCTALGSLGLRVGRARAR